jgi:ABC-2 type transport system permease protein
MLSIYKKEVRSFLGSLIAYIVMGVFLTLTGLFLWFVDGNSIFDLGVASLQVMFDISPYILIFLVSAITMKSISDEKRLGTLEIITTKPITDLQIILEKYFAALTLVAFTLLLTSFYAYSVYNLALPVGNIDLGSMLGSYLGLFLLAACYASIGLFASSLTDNQIVALIISMVLSFFFFAVLGMLGDLEILDKIGRSLNWFSLEFHYNSISRGVVDTRDLVFFLGFISVFLGGTKLVFESRKWS